MHRLDQGRCVAPNLIWSHDLAWLKDRSNLSIQCVEQRRRKWLSLDCVRHLVWRILFRLHQDEDWNVARMSLRSSSHLLEAYNENVAGAPLVDILDVHHLKAGLIHLMLRIEV